MQQNQNDALRYKTILTSFLRDMEAIIHRGDRQKLALLNETAEDDLLRKWLWLAIIGGSAIFFLILPLLLSLLSHFLPQELTACLWLVLKVEMGLVLLIFSLTIYCLYARRAD